MYHNKISVKLSVSRFAKDNGVYFEFHANSCFVKHRDTSQVLLHGILKDGLYVFPSFNYLNNCVVITLRFFC